MHAEGAQSEGAVRSSTGGHMASEAIYLDSGALREATERGMLGVRATESSPNTRANVETKAIFVWKKSAALMM